jgi:hypothetical protein
MGTSTASLDNILFYVIQKYANLLQCEIYIFLHLTQEYFLTLICR